MSRRRPVDKYLASISKGAIINPETIANPHVKKVAALFLDFQYNRRNRRFTDVRCSHADTNDF